MRQTLTPIAAALVLLSTESLLLPGAAQAQTASYTECRGYGGNRTCLQPKKTPWRVGFDTLYYDNQAPYGAESYCTSVKADVVAEKTVDAAIIKNVNLFTEQFVGDCLLDIQMIQWSSCEAQPEIVTLFQNTVVNRPNAPYHNRNVIAKSSCDVKFWSYMYPGAYSQGPWPWRDGCDKNAQAVQAPGGKILCLPDKNQEKDKPDPCDGTRHPIDMSTGNKYLGELDYSDARGDLTFRRHYNSFLDTAGMLGRAWTSEYDARIYHDQDALAYGGVEVISAQRGTGASIEMRAMGGDVFRPYSPDKEIHVKVLRDGQGAITGYILVDGAKLERYGATGLLSRVARADGYTRDLARDLDDRITTVTDSYGRKLQFTYQQNASVKTNFVETITTPRGGVIKFTYTQLGPDARIDRVEKPDSRSYQYVYDEQARLAGKVDERNVRFSTFIYDAEGNATQTKRAGDVEQISVTRGPVQPDGSFTVTHSDFGVVSTRQYGPVGNRMAMLSQSNPPGAGCSAATKTVAYDANVNPIQIDGFTGNRACRAFHPSRNLKLVEVEGLGQTDACSSVLADGAPLPTPAVKHSLEWHPDLPLLARAASPKLISTFVYNGQPDPTSGGALASCAPAAATLPDGKPIAVLCKAVEQATTDGNGGLGFAAAPEPGEPARVTRFTYNANGQVLSRTDPRNFATTYSYFTSTTTSATLGDPQSITPPKGLGVSFTTYNQDGFVLTASDANGLALGQTYDALNRVKTVATGSLTATYDYDEKGRMVGMTGPSGEQATLAYDDADRLTQVTDKLGNTVKYILDPAGNAVREEYKDPSGVLRRWIERGFDGLNRLSRIKGGQ